MKYQEAKFALAINNYLLNEHVSHFNPYKMRARSHVKSNQWTNLYDKYYLVDIHRNLEKKMIKTVFKLSFLT